MIATSNNRLKKDNKELRGKLKEIRKHNEQLLKDAYHIYPDGDKALWREKYEGMRVNFEAAENTIDALARTRDTAANLITALEAENARLNARVAELTAQLASASTPEGSE